MSAPLPPNPCLIAILLVVKSRAGPRFVFHYPPNAGADASPASKTSRRTRQDTADISSSDEDQLWSSDDDGVSFNGARWDPMSGNARASYKRSRYQDEDDDDLESPHMEENERQREQGQHKSPAWENVLGFGTDGLGTLLCPLRTFHKRRFEMTLDQLVFLGWPVFVREDGGWRKRREKRGKKGSVDNSSEDKGEDSAREKMKYAKRTDPEVSEDLDDTSGHDTAVEERMSNDVKEEVQVQDEKVPATGKKKDSMTMFNVIFVMSPPALEYHLRVREMYENVVKKFSRALKWEEARSDYVWKESKQILKLKEKAKESKTPTSTLWTQILSQSSLAKAISTLYTSISKSQIAQIRLSPTLSLSLQIPIPTSTSILPTATEPSLPGLWLTTATSLPDDPTTENTNLARHFALLLLDEEASILKDIEQSAGELAGPLTHYIRSSTPTKSFAQIAATRNIPLPDIQFLASHLIYWRRARAVPPLHQRDTYMVSPNADMGALASAAPLYAARFPTLPSLPKMLSMLSGPPKSYGNVIPSKDHKAAYFDILAWLLRGGWVTQLRTFAWIRVPADVKAAVAEELARERDSRDRDASATCASSSPAAKAQAPPPPRQSSQASSSSRPPSPSPSPAARRRRPSTLVSATDASSHDPHGPDAHSDPDSRHQHSSPPPPPPPSTTATTFHPSLIVDPHKSLDLESRYIAHIGTHHLPSLLLAAARSPPLAPDPNQQQQQQQQQQDTPVPVPVPVPAPIITPAEIGETWRSWTKYFNGQHALEKIAVREGVKRKRVVALLGVMEGGGVLRVWRGW